MVDEKPGRRKPSQAAHVSVRELEKTLSRLVFFLHEKVLSGELKPAQARLVTGVYLNILHDAGLDEPKVLADSHTTRVVLRHAKHAACSRLSDLLPKCRTKIEREFNFKSIPIR
jgi:hypothetical protein